ncbi:MAG: hypothetical protein LLG93_14485 [Deltaproteobacteria bacterium]|nr:hypothetical protein [Deltaproteobacteria bacterium]
MVLHSRGGGSARRRMGSGWTVVSDGSRKVDIRLQRVLTADRGIGVLRHSDAGYEITMQTMNKHGIRSIIKIIIMGTFLCWPRRVTSYVQYPKAAYAA